MHTQRQMTKKFYICGRSGDKPQLCLTLEFYNLDPTCALYFGEWEKMRNNY